MAGPMVERGRAKINLALHVLRQNSTGYHELDSIVAFADVADELGFKPAVKTSLAIEGRFASGLAEGSDNLVLRAYEAYAERSPLPPLAITLRKNLPVASGIGGGSADAAATLRALQSFAAQPLAPLELAAVALRLGADVPVCLYGKTCRMGGIGESLNPIAPLPWSAIVLVNPLKDCRTATVFKNLGLQPGQSFGSPLIENEPQTWRNDLTAAACGALPEIAAVLAVLQATAGLSHIRMSGSGATCFGLTRSLDDAKAAAALLQKQHPAWWVVAARLG